MMGISIQLILVACIVYFGSTFVQPYNQILSEPSTNNANDGSEIREKFNNLFDSIAKSDREKSEIFLKTLEHGASRGEQVFDSMKGEMRNARKINMHKHENFFKKKAMENVAVKKREANAPNPRNTTTTRMYETTTPYDYDYDDDDPFFRSYGPETITDPAAFEASPIEGPFLEESYYDCLMEAKWEMDDQRFYIKSLKDQNKILAKLGMKLPDLSDQLYKVELFYNTSCSVIGRKMRGEEESEEKYDLTYKNIFLKLSRIWLKMIAELDKHTPKYHCAKRVKKMKDEMEVAYNSSHETYYHIAYLQTKMSTKPVNLSNATFTTPSSTLNTNS